MALILSWWTLLWLAPSERSTPTQQVLTLTAVLAAGLAALRCQRLYRARNVAVRFREQRGLVRAAAATGATAAVVGWWLDDPRYAVTGLIGFIASTLALTMARSYYRAWLKAERVQGHYSWPVVVVGDNDDARSVVRRLLDQPEQAIRPIGYCSRGGSPTSTMCGLRWLGEPARVAQLGRPEVTGAVVVASALDEGDLNVAIRELHGAGLHAHLASGITGVHHRRLRLQPVAHDPMIYVEPSCLSKGQLITKRVLDVVLASVLLVVNAPLMAATALIIRLTDRGPALFKQERVGQHGEPITVFKFRSMVVDSEGLLAELSASNERQGPLFKMTDDPRVTRVGRIIRSTSIDELPQLFNVLQGTMSLVGPRPALASEVAQFDEQLLCRLSVKPGVTGLWQVEGRDKPSFDAYRRLDLFYVENWSLGLDLAILAATVATVLARGVRQLRNAPLPTVERQVADHQLSPS